MTRDRFESRFAYVRFAVDQMLGAVLSVVLGSWAAVGAWRAEGFAPVAGRQIVAEAIRPKEHA